MSPYLTLEVRLVGMSTVLGFILMASYDFLRLFRFFVPHGRLWTGIEDFFYWIYAAVMTFLRCFTRTAVLFGRTSLRVCFSA